MFYTKNASSKNIAFFIDKESGNICNEGAPYFISPGASSSSYYPLPKQSKGGEIFSFSNKIKDIVHM